jgi:hypothetical protein
MADDIVALVESLFPVTMSEILRDLTALDFSFVVPSKVCQTVDILRGPIPSPMPDLAAMMTYRRAAKSRRHSVAP